MSSAQQVMAARDGTKDVLDYMELGGDFAVYEVEVPIRSCVRFLEYRMLPGPARPSYGSIAGIMTRTFWGA